MTLLSVSEFAKEIRLSEITVRRRLKSGEIPHRRLGGRFFFTLEDLQNYIEHCAVPVSKMETLNGGSNE